MPTTSDLFFGIAWNFREPVIVLLGSSGSLRQFALFLRTLTEADICRPDFIAYMNAELEIGVSEGPCSFRVADGVVTWTVSSRSLRSYAEQVESVALCPAACHNYLDADVRAHWTLMVSKGEYSTDIFQ